jgi:uncharacterized membrane protein YfcA
MLEQLPPHVLIVSAVFLLAGAVKGMTGMGLPTVAMGALGAVMPLAHSLIVSCARPYKTFFSPYPIVGSRRHRARP